MHWGKTCYCNQIECIHLNKIFVYTKGMVISDAGSCKCHTKRYTWTFLLWGHTAKHRTAAPSSKLHELKSTVE